MSATARCSPTVFILPPSSLVALSTNHDVTPVHS
jgi:hypothetical protein